MENKRRIRLVYDRSMPKLPHYDNRQKLSEWLDFYLEMGCAKCNGRSVVFPMKLLIEQHGNTTFGELLRKLKCKECGGQPSEVYLCESQKRTAGHGGPDAAWALELELRR